MLRMNCDSARGVAVVSPASSDRNRPASEGGFALILALLALMLLTFLGLTLATLTSTELQVATNYRWSQQAHYNAEAGVEAAKTLLRNQGDWPGILPPPRAGSWTVAGFTTGVKPAAKYSEPDKGGFASRNFEYSECDARGNGAGYGVVLHDGSAVAPYQNVSSIFEQNLNGTFTVWIRRELKTNSPADPFPAGTFSDSPDNDVLVLTSEGTAPYVREGLGSSLAASAAVRVLEVTMTRALVDVCGNRTGQEGGGPEGAGFSPCDPITGKGLEGVLGRTPDATTNQ